MFSIAESAEVFRLNKNTGETKAQFWARCMDTADNYLLPYCTANFENYVTDTPPTPPVNVQTFEAGVANCEATSGDYAACMGLPFPPYNGMLNCNCYTTVDEEICEWRALFHVDGAACWLDMP